ncbi:MAG TPA: T9SS type A sorting domain-containing protein [Ignavibacteria bacterium]|nr:T9SS type A sorting domain-containing protein [Ignavibacteria bacterium]
MDKKPTPLFLLAFLSVFFSSYSGSYSQWTQTTGISENIATSIVRSGDKLFAGSMINILTSGNIYSSTNNGDTWNAVNTGFALSGIFCMITKGNYIFAGTYEDGMLISSNNGATWQLDPVNGTFGTGIFDAVVSGNNIIAYANTGAVVYASTNNGDNWFGVTGLPTNFGIINYFYNDGSTLYAGARNGLFYSTNNGLNWIYPANNGLPSNPDGSKPMTSMIKTDNKIIGGCLNKLFVSTDNGNNWTQAGTLELSGSFSNFFAMEKYNSVILTGIRYVGTSGGPYGVYYDRNTNYNWINFTNNLPANISIYSMFRENNMLYITTHANQGIWKVNLDVLTSAGNPNTVIPGKFSLSNAYPNPFNPSTSFQVSLPQRSNVVLKVFNSLGKEVNVIANSEFNAGMYNFQWNADGFNSGVYFLRLTTENFTETKKLMLLK